MLVCTLCPFPRNVFFTEFMFSSHRLVRIFLLQNGLTNKQLNKHFCSIWKCAIWKMLPTYTSIPLNMPSSLLEGPLSKTDYSCQRPQYCFPVAIFLFCTLGLNTPIKANFCHNPFEWSLKASFTVYNLL